MQKQLHEIVLTNPSMAIVAAVACGILLGVLLTVVVIKPGILVGVGRVVSVVLIGVGVGVLVCGIMWICSADEPSAQLTKYFASPQECIGAGAGGIAGGILSIILSFIGLPRARE